MKNFVLELVTQTASFRNPDFQNFHKSLDLPPPTTIVGLAGAALGLSPWQAQDFFESFEFEFGVYGVHHGRCSDTWKYNKEIRDMRTYNPGKDGSIIQKEYLISSRFLLSFSSTDEEKLHQLANGFIDPVYALTMGNSDSLAFVKNVVYDVSDEVSFEVENCLLAGNVIDNVISLASEKLAFSIYDSAQPLTYDLPIKFAYSSDYGRRAVAKIGTFSMIGRKMRLNYEVKGLTYKGTFIPSLSL